jgi:hypothetical protein
MKIIELKSKIIDLSVYKKRTALDSDAEQLINYDCLITENGVPKILYVKLKNDTDALRWAVKNIKYSTSIRSAGLKTQSAIFGYKPKIVMRSDFCSSTSMINNFPKQHYFITEYAKKLTDYYKEYFPDIFNIHEKIVKEKILNEWTIEGTPFTSGIVNKDNALKYHHDAGNFKGVLSNMVAFKRGMIGGRLVFPEYNIKFEIDDNTLSVFDGQSILHGVTNFEKENEQAYRYTIVYYSLEQMWKCDSINEELNRIRKKKKEREFNRINPEHLKTLVKAKKNLDIASDKAYQAHFNINKNE